MKDRWFNYSQRITVGYGIQIETEGLRDAVRYYLDGNPIFTTKKEALAFIKQWSKEGSLNEGEKARVFKIIAEKGYR